MMPSLCSRSGLWLLVRLIGTKLLTSCPTVHGQRRYKAAPSTARPECCRSPKTTGARAIAEVLVLVLISSVRSSTYHKTVHCFEQDLPYLRSLVLIITHTMTGRSSVSQCCLGYERCLALACVEAGEFVTTRAHAQSC